MLAADLSHTGYFEANRRAAAARSRRDADEFWHWSKVAAEVARICPAAEALFVYDPFEASRAR